MNRKSREKDETLQLAIQAYQNHEYPSVRACAKAYGLNESSLRTRLRNGENKSTSHAYQQLLIPAQEQMLVQWILDLDSQGHTPSYSKVREMLKLFKVFKLRNPQITTLLRKTLDSARVNGTNPEALFKKNYQGQIADLAQFDDSAPIKKIQFCQCYEKAHQKGLISTTIKSGWRAASLVPFNPDKVQLTLDETWITTLENVHDLTVTIRRIQATIQVDRPVRTFLRKVQKAIGRSNASEAKAIHDYKGLKTKLDSMRSTKGRTKVQFNPNSTFASIEDIIKAQQEEEAKQALYKSNNPESGLELSAKTVEESGMDSFLINFQI
ncbi:hypothetical protein B7463_g3062, partial [Scytalidium lignicola]